MLESPKFPQLPLSLKVRMASRGLARGASTHMGMNIAKNPATCKILGHHRSARTPRARWEALRKRAADLVASYPLCIAVEGSPQHLAEEGSRRKLVYSQDTSFHERQPYCKDRVEDYRKAHNRNR